MFAYHILLYHLRKRILISSYFTRIYYKIPRPRLTNPFSPKEKVRALGMREGSLFGWQKFRLSEFPNKKGRV